MKAFLWLFFLSILADIPSFPQSSSSTDSLEQLLASGGQDSSRVLLLNELANKYLASQPTKAKELAEESVLLASKINFLRGKAVALICLGDYHFRQSNYANAIDYGTQSLKVATGLRDSLYMADAYRLLGNTHTFGLKQYDLALDYQLKGLKIFLQRSDSKRIAALYGSITWIYAITNQSLTEAHNLADKGILLSRELKNYQLLSYNFNSKGLLFFREGRLDSSLVNFKKSNEAAALADDKAVIAYNKSIMGNIYLQLKNYQKAIAIFKQSLDESKLLNVREVMKDAYDGLAKAYQATHQYEAAYDFHCKYTDLKDSLVNWETTQKAIFFRFSFEEEKREAKIAQLEKERRQSEKEKKAYVIFFSAIFLMLLAGTGLIIANNRQKKRANLILQEKNTEIEVQNEELVQSREEIASQRDIVADQNHKLKQINNTKDKLFSIISHDLRGPIASLRSLLGLVVCDKVTDAELKMLMPKLNQNVGGIQDTLENLLEWSRSQMDGLKSSPKKLDLHVSVKQTVLLFNEAASTKRISLIDNSTPAQIIADENHVHLILRNLVNNAIKFTTAGGLVTINTARKNEFVELSISDSGIGISPENLSKLFAKDTYSISYGTQGEKGTGLGLSLCKEMAEANGGKITVNSEVGKGSTFYVYLMASP